LLEKLAAGLLELRVEHPTKNRGVGIDSYRHGLSMEGLECHFKLTVAAAMRDPG
jgi:hypothetical protein